MGTMVGSGWCIFTFVLLAAVVMANAQSGGSIDVVPRYQDHKDLITTTVRRLLRVIVEGLKDLYGRVWGLKRYVYKEAMKSDRLQKLVINMRRILYSINERIRKNKLATDKRISDTESLLLFRVNDSHNTLMNLFREKYKQLDTSLSRVKKIVQNEKLSFVQLQAEFAEGEFMINNSIHDVDIPRERSIMIVGGGSSGGVRIRYIGDWTYVCDEHWTLQDAVVACRSMGYNEITPRAYTARSRAPVKIDSIACTGREDNLAHCPHIGHAFHACQSGQIAAVDCNPHVPAIPGRPGPQNPSRATITVGSTRLVGGGDGSIGRLEVKHAGIWGTVCDDKWIHQNAMVVCRSLNLPYESASAHVGHAYPHSYKVPNGTPVWLDDVICDGNESDLIHCSHGSFGTHDCDEYENVGVQCE